MLYDKREGQWVRDSPPLPIVLCGLGDDFWSSGYTQQMYVGNVAVPIYSVCCITHIPTERLKKGIGY